jgi:hypothetical protein
VRRRRVETAKLRLGDEEPTPIVDVGSTPAVSSVAVLRSLLDRALMALDDVGTPGAHAIARDIRAHLVKMNPDAGRPDPISLALAIRYIDSEFATDGEVTGDMIAEGLAYGDYYFGGSRPSVGEIAYASTFASEFDGDTWESIIRKADKIRAKDGLPKRKAR